MEEEYKHIGYQERCEACQYHCSKCGNRALDETRSRFLTYRELYENGGMCDFRCKGSELKNSFTCYHCGAKLLEEQPFCDNNCYKESK